MMKVMLAGFAAVALGGCQVQAGDGVQGQAGPPGFATGTCPSGQFAVGTDGGQVVCAPVIVPGDAGPSLADLATAVATLQHAVATLTTDNTALRAQIAVLQDPDPKCLPGYTQDATVTGYTVCKKGVDEMVKVGTGASAFWIDRYEASVWVNADGTGGQKFPGGGPDDTTVAFPKNGQVVVPLFALSIKGANPSANMTWFQAAEACEASGKRLPTGREWLRGARGTFDPGANDGANGNTRCNTSGTNLSAKPRSGGLGVGPTRTTSCMSDWGAQDMIGNLSEWTDEWYAGTAWPGKQDGESATAGQAKFGVTYADDGVWGVTGSIQGEIADQAVPATGLRGGTWSSGSLAGVFAIGVNAGPSAASEIIGFRCVAR